MMMMIRETEGVALRCVVLPGCKHTHEFYVVADNSAFEGTGGRRRMRRRRRRRRLPIRGIVGDVSVEVFFSFSL